MTLPCKAAGHKFVPDRGYGSCHQHRCEVCGLVERCDFEVSCTDVSEWQWRCDLPDIYVEQYAITRTCKKCGGSEVEYRNSRDDLP